MPTYPHPCTWKAWSYPESNATCFSFVLWNNNQSKECDWVMEFALSHFKVLTYGFSGYERKKRL